MSHPAPDPAEPQPMPDEAGDGYVAHSTPEPSDPHRRRFLLLRFLPLLLVLAGIGLWVAYR